MLHALTRRRRSTRATRISSRSILAISTIDIGNPHHQRHPGRARAVFNVRFNDDWSSATVERVAASRSSMRAGGRYELEIKVSGESFLDAAGRGQRHPDAARSSASPAARPNSAPPAARRMRASSTASARCAEFGLSNLTMHKVDEHVAVADIAALAAIYRTVLELYFAHEAMLTPARGVVRALRRVAAGAARPRRDGVVRPQPRKARSRSFWAAAICYPGFVVLLLLRLSAADVHAPAVYRILLVESIGYVVGWCAFPLAALPFCRWVATRGARARLHHRLQLVAGAADGAAAADRGGRRARHRAGLRHRLCRDGRLSSRSSSTSGSSRGSRSMPAG